MDQPKLIAPFVWSVGDRRAQDLPSHLFSVMRYSTNTALEKLSSGDAEDSLTCAVMLGLSIEAALKWALCKTSPVLIADRGSSKSRAFLAAPLSAPMAINGLKTINGADAYVQWRELRPDHPKFVTAPLVDEVLSVRNAAIHMGVVHVPALHEAARVSVRILRLIFEVEGEDIAGLWRPEFEELLEELAEEDAGIIQLRVTSKRVQAESALRRLSFKHGKNFEEVASALSASLTARHDGETRVTVDCPVCQYEGLLHRYIEEPDSNFTGSSYPDHRPSGVRYAYVEFFECAVCGIYFEGDEIEQDSYFEEFQEEELDPSAEFYDALHSWEMDELHERENEAYLRMMRENEL